MKVSNEVLENFKIWMESEFLSPETISCYFRTVRMFCLGKNIKEFDLDFFENLKIILKEQGLTLKTIGRYVVAIKKFLFWIKIKFNIEYVDLDKVKCKKGKLPKPDFLEREEIYSIRQLPINNPYDLRARVLFEFLLNTGCRISEALGINRKEINWDKSEVEVLGKGNKKRIVFLGDSEIWLKRYLSERKDDSCFLFINQYCRKLHRRDGYFIIKHLGKAAGLRPIKPHLLRSTFCTYLIWTGTDPRTVQELMGHDDVETTLRYYSAVTHDRMREAHTKLSDTFKRVPIRILNYLIH